MAWSSLADIDSVSLKDNNEYFSRPDERVLELVSERKDDIVVYGAVGKFMRHVTLMLIRAIRETGGRGQIVHLVSSLRPDPDVKMKAKFTGTPAERHLLADGRRLEEKLGKSLDSLQDIIRGQTYWVVNGGFRRGLDHLIGKSL